MSAVDVIHTSSRFCFKYHFLHNQMYFILQVSHAWIIKNGLLFERTVSPSEVNAPRK